MKENQPLSIPTRTHLKKFLLKTYHTTEPFKLDATTSIGKNLMSSMVDKLEYVNMNDKLTDTLKVTLSKRFAERGPRIKRLNYINSLIQCMFEEAIILWIYSSGVQGVNPLQAVKAFLTFFDIDESEYNYESAYKLWTRSREKERKKDKQVDYVRKVMRKSKHFSPKAS